MIGINPFAMAQNLGYLANIVQDVSIILGLCLFMAGLFRLKRYAEARTYMSHQMTIAAPLLMLVGAVALLSLPFTLNTALLNFWSTSSPESYTGSSAGYEQLIPPILMFVRIIGVCAFMRGIILFSRAGGEQSHQGTMSKAMLHILGGILCVHILGTLHLLQNMLGFTGL